MSETKPEGSVVEAPERCGNCDHTELHVCVRQGCGCVARVHQDVQAADVGIPKATFELLQRQIEQIRSCPSAMCCHCIEVLCGDVIPIVDSVVERLAASPVQQPDEVSRALRELREQDDK